MRSRLRAYYHQAYSTVREFSADAVVVFCVLYWWDYWAWADELREPSYHNVVVDYHLPPASFELAIPDPRAMHCCCVPNRG